ncbi:hypothetical protein G4G28_02170 [Massilia sp. Dwa41.01b]|uniref:hypothetical protein n=1 Tax=Massilia sp. Dwa41.01b TaxID=2709302 RepID=UPI0016003713|nr:hypothetical protein [Massilia sp. Dwa41.01b]QNA87568.1 hypothetical protein G4G28_02170 [Massilia sp. Dwa41.01b]
MMDAMTIALLLTGLASVVFYLWRRKIVDALLAAVATAALALLAHGWPLPGRVEPRWRSIRRAPGLAAGRACAAADRRRLARSAMARPARASARLDGTWLAHAAPGLPAPPAARTHVRADARARRQDPGAPATAG